MPDIRCLAVRIFCLGPPEDSVFLIDDPFDRLDPSPEVFGMFPDGADILENKLADCVVCFACPEDHADFFFHWSGIKVPADIRRSGLARVDESAADLFSSQDLVSPGRDRDPAKIRKETAEPPDAAAERFTATVIGQPASVE